VTDADPEDLVTVMEKLSADRGWLARLQAESLEWAAAHSWEALLPVWEKELARACRR
jgi:hypothetical protein